MSQDGASKTSKKDIVPIKDSSNIGIIKKLKRAFSFSTHSSDAEKRNLKHSASVSVKSRPDKLQRFKKEIAQEKHVDFQKIIERSLSIPDQTPERPHSYNMTYKKRGLALIFNHKNFLYVNPRTGTDKDAKDISEVLNNLEFKIRRFEDLNIEAIKMILRGVCEEDHSDYDCIIVVVMTHGNDDDTLHAFNFSYHPNILWEEFKNCKTLEGKPKIFLIQACRGERSDKGYKVRTETDGRTVHNLSSNIQDMLVMRSSFEGYYSWRNSEKGTWFIQEICKQFKSYDEVKNLDLLTALTFVNRRIALEYTSTTSNEHNDTKQVCSILSTLRKLVYFDPKHGDLL